MTFNFMVDRAGREGKDFGNQRLESGWADGRMGASDNAGRLRCCQAGQSQLRES
jgi:hypothetical protein